MKKLKILIINLDNIDFTRECLNDLDHQTSDEFEIVLVDQNSSEEGTKEFLDSITDSRIEVVRNAVNMPLHDVWSWFHKTYQNEFLCYLNNDINLATNFVETTLSVFEKEDYVGIVVHSSNHSDYSIATEELSYAIVEPFKYMQGWDFTIRNVLFPKKLPEYIKTYCGDDYIFDYVYKTGFNLAYVLNSPIIHYEGQSKKSVRNTIHEDINNFIANKNRHYLKINYNYSQMKPTFDKIEYGDTKIKYFSDRLNEFYEISLVNPFATNSIDIHEHMPILKKYGEECKHITEMGVRGGSSTLAFIMAKPKDLISIDIQSTPQIEYILSESSKMLNHSFILGDTLTLEIEETELLFIDTLHTYNQLISELNRHEAKVKKYIILHDTTTFGRVDESIYHHASNLIKSQTVNKTGLRTAMEDFLENNTNWEILEDKTNNNGLTILKRNG